MAGIPIAILVKLVSNILTLPNMASKFCPGNLIFLWIILNKHKKWNQWLKMTRSTTKEFTLGQRLSRSSFWFRRDVRNSRIDRTVCSSTATNKVKKIQQGSRVEKRKMNGSLYQHSKNILNITYKPPLKCTPNCKLLIINVTIRGFTLLNAHFHKTCDEWQFLH